MHETVNYTLYVEFVTMLEKLIALKLTSIMLFCHYISWLHMAW
jgi:hypothetical protein